MRLLVLTVASFRRRGTFRKSYAKISDMMDRIYGDINPLMRHASTIADNVNYITTAVRVDVQKVSQTVAWRTSADVVRSTEERIKELNALLAVVQEEAESAFISTASTVRGVRTGIHEAFETEESARWQIH
jgi:uridine phosphorylase